MNKKYLYIAGAAFGCLLILRACSHDDQPVSVAEAIPAGQPPVVVQNPAPVVVHDSDNGGFFSGLLMGHMMSGSHGYSHHTTVVNHYSRPAYSAPRYTRSRTVSRTTRSYYGRRR